MWYFAWVLGLGLAGSIGVLNALWYELRVLRDETTDESVCLPTL